jgi:glycosyltransferase involved in cell wall biosynthesis
MKNRKKVQYDYLFLTSWNSPFHDVGYGDKHLFYLAESLSNKGFKTAIMYLPFVDISVKNEIRRNHGLTLVVNLMGILYDLVFIPSLLNKLINRTAYHAMGKNYASRWKYKFNVELLFSREKFILKSKRLVFNYWGVANFISKKSKGLPPSYYIINHNYENGDPLLTQLITRTYEENFRKIVTSDVMLKRFGLNGACKMVVAVDPEKLAGDNSATKIERSVLIPLRTFPAKGARIAVKAIELVLKAQKGVTIYTFGDYLEPFNRGDHISCGRVDDDTLMRLYSQSDIFVSPSLEDGVPGPVIEAMAHGCAVITTDVSGASEVVTDGYNGRIIPINDPEAMASAILSLASNKALIHKFVKNSTEVIKKFSKESMTDSFLRAVEYYEQT